MLLVLLFMFGCASQPKEDLEDFGALYGPDFLICESLYVINYIPILSDCHSAKTGLALQELMNPGFFKMRQDTHEVLVNRINENQKIEKEMLKTQRMDDRVDNGVGEQPSPDRVQ